MNRLKKAAAANRKAAKVQRAHGRKDAAERYGSRAADLESGRVEDRTNGVLALALFALKR